MAVSLTAQEDQATKQFKFGIFLYEKKEFYRAISEFERFKYFNQQNKDISKANFYIGLSYFKANHFKEAKLSFLESTNSHELLWKALFLAADSAFLADEYLQSLSLYDNIYVNCPDMDLHTRALAGKTWPKLMSRDFPPVLSMYDEFLKTYPAHALTGDIEYLNNSVKNISKFKPLSPILAAGLSTVIPGAGQIYDKRPGDGVISFIAIGVLGTSSYLLWKYYDHKEIAIAFSITTAFFYAGNIYSAFSSAHKYNKLYYQKNLQSLKENYWRGAPFERP